MERRKIQLIANSTYTLSLPKQWVKDNKLKERDEILVHEQNDKTLLLSPDRLGAGKGEINEISLNVDDFLIRIISLMKSTIYMVRNSI